MTETDQSIYKANKKHIEYVGKYSQEHSENRVHYRSISPLKLQYYSPIRAMTNSYRISI